MARLVGLHVPIGVLLVVGLVQLAAQAWRLPLPARVGSDGAAPAKASVGALS
jgi:hypothetical protein